jgi:hypothetical protein
MYVDLSTRRMHTTATALANDSKNSQYVFRRAPDGLPNLFIYHLILMIIAAQNASSASNLRQTDTKGPDAADARTIMLHNNSELFTDAVRHLLPVLVAIDASSAGLSRLLIL